MSGAGCTWRIALYAVGCYAVLTAAASAADAQTGSDGTIQTAAEATNVAASWSADLEEARGAAAGAVRAAAEATGAAVELRDEQLPQVEAPQVEAPQVEAPQLNMTEITVPEIDVPSPESLIAAAQQLVDGGSGIPGSAGQVAAEPREDVAPVEPPSSDEPIDAARASQQPQAPTPDATEQTSPAAEAVPTVPRMTRAGASAGTAAVSEARPALRPSHGGPGAGRAGPSVTGVASLPAGTWHEDTGHRGDGLDPVDHLPSTPGAPLSSPGPTSQSSTPLLPVADLTSVADSPPSGWTAVERWAHAPGLRSGALSEPTFSPD